MDVGTGQGQSLLSDFSKLQTTSLIVNPGKFLGWIIKYRVLSNLKWKRWIPGVSTVLNSLYDRVISLAYGGENLTRSTV